MKYNAILEYPTFTRKGKSVKLSANIFKKMHWGSQAKCKKDYADLVEGFVESLPKFNWVKPKYTMYFKGNQKKDLDNYWFPVHKFLMDAIVEGGKLEDDNFKYVRGFEVDFGEAGKDIEDCVVVELIGEINDENDKNG
jgi:hypothetical protein